MANVYVKIIKRLCLLLNTLLTFLLTSLLTFACYPIFKSAIKAFKLKVKYRSMNESPNPRSAYLELLIYDTNQ